MKCATVISIFVVLAVSTASAQTFDLGWNTIDDGGAMFSAGGVFELGGTIGQPDAGAMTGGIYELVGGFWSVPSGPAICRGDTNCDGQISYADINPFVQALSNLPAWQVQYPTCPWQNCDINADGVVSYADINPFVQKLGSPGPCPPAGPAICRGDTNCDGQISFADINPFVQALGNQSAWQAAYPTCPWQNCDVNADGVVSFADINPFVAKLGSPGPCP
jgi:hypothetical protein